MFLEPQSARAAIGERKIRTAFLHMFRLSLVNTLSSILKQKKTTCYLVCAFP